MGSRSAYTEEFFNKLAQAEFNDEFGHLIHHEANVAVSSPEVNDKDVLQRISEVANMVREMVEEYLIEEALHTSLLSDNYAEEFINV